VATIKNGTSRYNIKDYIVNQIAPKYFDSIENLNELQVGLFGYITDVLSETTQDTFFAMGSMYKESFPQLAELPESIYNHALIYQLSNIFASPAACNFTLLVSEEAILDASTVEGSYRYFFIDSGMQINIDDKSFMLDYDIEIISKSTTNGWVHSVQYVMDKTNDLSSLNNPFIRSSIFVADNGNRYIAMQVYVRQVSKKTISDTILNNDIINSVQLEYTFNDQLANFDIYYRAPGAATYTQLKKLLANSIKIDAPFCFYKLRDDNTLQITFSNDDTYFQPEYNSDIIVEIYTTQGSEGNFDDYTGDQISIEPKYEKYASNRGMVFMGAVIGSSVGGSDRKTIDELKNDTIKAYSTMKAFSTTNDLNLYFDEIRENSTQKSQILFMRKRDDVFERLYSAFILFRDTDNNVIPTNTLDVRIRSTDIDYFIQQTARHVVRAGKIYKYYGDNDSPYAGILSDVSYTDDLDGYEGSTDFVYVNPFLTIIGTNPLSVGFYLNTISDTIPIASVNVNTESFYQFIIDSVNIHRDALIGDMEYKISLQMSPTATLPMEAFTLVEDDTPIEPTDRTFVNPTDGHEYIDNKNLTVIAEVLARTGERKFFVELKLNQFDSQYYYYSGSIITNDYISTNGDIQITGGFRDAETYSENITDPELIPGTNCTIAIYVLYKYPDGTITKETEFNRFEELKDFSLANKYIMKDNNLANFVFPIEQISSYVQYSVRETTGKYGFRLEAIPLIKANYLKMSGCREAFIKNFTSMYEYLEESMDKLTNNFGIDLKFFNTYGYSQHYFLADKEEPTHIDRVNIKLTFKAKFNLTSGVDAEVEYVKEYIKSLVESTELSLASSPSFYLSTITAKCMQRFSSLVYITYGGLNDYDSSIQALESDVNEYNIINGVIETATIIPEYLNIDYVISKGERTAQVIIEVV
jgi:hypothetical protein